MRATGHEIDIGEPRHPLSVCGTCLRTHISMALTQGKICVRCPFDGCGRALQTRELKDHVSQGVYQGLLEALRAAEEEHDVTEITAALAGFSRELRHCPRCRVLIEKNEGCSSMRCCAPPLLTLSFRCSFTLRCGCALCRTALRCSASCVSPCLFVCD